MSNSLRTPWSVAPQAPLSMEFSRQVFWSGVLQYTWNIGILEYFLSQGNLPNPGTESESLVSPALVGRFFTTMPPEVEHYYLMCGREYPDCGGRKPKGWGISEVINVPPFKSPRLSSVDCLGTRDGLCGQGLFLEISLPKLKWFFALKYIPVADSFWYLAKLMQFCNV